MEETQGAASWTYRSSWATMIPCFLCYILRRSLMGDCGYMWASCIVHGLYGLRPSISRNFMRRLKCTWIKIQWLTENTLYIDGFKFDLKDFVFYSSRKTFVCHLHNLQVNILQHIIITFICIRYMFDNTLIISQRELVWILVWILTHVEKRLQQNA